MGLFMCLEHMRGAGRGSSPHVPLTLSPCPSSGSTWNIGRGSNALLAMWIRAGAWGYSGPQTDGKWPGPSTALPLTPPEIGSRALSASLEFLLPHLQNGALAVKCF